MRDMQQRLQQAVQQLREVQNSVSRLTFTTPQMTDDVTEYLEHRVNLSSLFTFLFKYGFSYLHKILNIIFLEIYETEYYELYGNSH